MGQYIGEMVEYIGRLMILRLRRLAQHDVKPGVQFAAAAFWFEIN